MTIRFCPQCGASVEGRQSCCGMCGAPLVEMAEADNAPSDSIDWQPVSAQPVRGDASIGALVDDLDEPDESGQDDDAPDAGLLCAVSAASLPDPLSPPTKNSQPEPWNPASTSLVSTAVPVVPVTLESAKAARQARQIEELKQFEWTSTEDDSWDVEGDGTDSLGGVVIVLGVIAIVLLVLFLILTISVTMALAA